MQNRYITTTTTTTATTTTTTTTTIASGVSSFLMAHQHILRYSVPDNRVKDVIKDKNIFNVNAG